MNKQLPVLCSECNKNPEGTLEECPLWSTYKKVECKCCDDCKDKCTYEASGYEC